MPHRNRSAPPAKSSPRPRVNFRQRYEALEAQRAELIARLGMLSATTQQHAGYKRALKLLNATFRKTKLPQRLAVLKAASWLIDVLEQVTITL